MLSEGLFPEYGYCKLSLKKSELWHEEYLLPLPCLLQVYLLMPSCACVLIQVAAVSGDARRALDICRRAVELAQQGSQIVKVKKLHVISHRSCIFYPLYFYTHPVPSVLPHSFTPSGSNRAYQCCFGRNVNNSFNCRHGPYLFA